MRMVIDRLKEVHNKYGDEPFIEHMHIIKGLYFIVDKDNNIEYFDIRKDLAVENPLLKSLCFYEGAMSANRCLCPSSKEKKIMSVTPFALIMNFKNFSLADDVLRTYMESHFNVIKTRYYSDIDTEKIINNFYEIRTKVAEIIKENKIKLDKPTEGLKISIFTTEAIEKYKESYDKYLNENVFGNEKDKDGKQDITIVDGVEYGAPSFSLNLSNKKPMLSVNPYSKYCTTMSKEDAKIYFYISKIRNDVNELINENQDFNLNIDVEIDSNGSTGIYGYSSAEKRPIKKGILEEFNILSSEYTNIIKTSSEKSRMDMVRYIDKNTTKLFLLENIINTEPSNLKKLKDTMDKLKSEIKQSYISGRSIFSMYFKDDKNVDISMDLEKLLWTIYLNKAKNTEYFKSLHENFDSMLSILNYVNNKKGMMQMAEQIKKIWGKLIDSRSEVDYTIETDEEFFFISGQLAYWISSYSKMDNKKKTGGLILDALNIAASTDIKDMLINKYQKYSHAITSYSTAFINILYQAILMYKIDENVRMENNLKYYYHAGLIGKNIRFEKFKKDEEHDSEED